MLPRCVSSGSWWPHFTFLGCHSSQAPRPWSEDALAPVLCDGPSLSQVICLTDLTHSYSPIFATLLLSVPPSLLHLGGCLKSNLRHLSSLLWACWPWVLSDLMWVRCLSCLNCPLPLILGAESCYVAQAGLDYGLHYSLRISTVMNTMTISDLRRKMFISLPHHSPLLKKSGQEL